MSGRTPKQKDKVKSKVSWGRPKPAVVQYSRRSGAEKYANALEIAKAAGLISNLATTSRMNLDNSSELHPAAGSRGSLTRTASLHEARVEAATGPRSLYNSVTAQRHCLGVFGQPDIYTQCWLCGFNIYFLQEYNSMADTDPKKHGTYKYDQSLYDKPICEHIIPVKVAKGLLGTLYKPTGMKIPEGTNERVFANTLRAEYQYAHYTCNAEKGVTHYITDDIGVTNYCSLGINTDKIKEDLDKFATYIKYPTKAPITFIPTDTTKKSITYNNIVEACLDHYEPNNTTGNPMELVASSEDDLTIFRANAVHNWKTKQLKRITERLKILIQYIKLLDKCGTEHAGSWFSLYNTFMGKPALTSGALFTVRSTPNFNSESSAALGLLLLTANPALMQEAQSLIHNVFRPVPGAPFTPKPLGTGKKHSEELLKFFTIPEESNENTNTSMNGGCRVFRKTCKRLRKHMRKTRRKN